ncbi:hypothetical protein D5S18_00585 [Nocardia panacis]|uniref:Cell wall anchor protein n=1 Tax=Nocardia panacis TaxID=2340916 RepID=A0A3A4KWL0_9NOCA|nr:DUF6319 family protein [Nocardia panacis]RJO79811.1 hypothetical protein D5S18_00585 [Nocardia panacis]
MPSPRTKPQPLSDTEIQQIAAEVADGRPPMVWFTAAAVGIPAGRSGKVVALGDPSDGDFLQVRPTGSKDVLSFSPLEVTLTKPQRDKAVPKKAATKAAVATEDAPAQPKSTTRKESTVTQPSTLPSAPIPAPVRPVPDATPAAPKPVPSQQDSAEDKNAPKPAAKAAKAPAARAKAKTPEVTVTLTGTADGDWTVDVVNGKKRAIRGLSVPGSSVAQAAKLLHPEVAEVVSGVLEAVRGAQRAKVEQLQAELEAARRALEDLDD